jgi:hypothetical protein
LEEAMDLSQDRLILELDIIRVNARELQHSSFRRLIELLNVLNNSWELGNPWGKTHSFRNYTCIDSCKRNVRQMTQCLHSWTLKYEGLRIDFYAWKTVLFLEWIIMSRCKGNTWRMLDLRSPQQWLWRILYYGMWRSWVWWVLSNV